MSEQNTFFQMANQGLARPGSLVNDPFAGTGSILYAAAWYGAYVFGSDIDGRPMRGKGAVVLTDPRNLYEACS
jgi:tRNA G10  N-methylase Trm11